MVQVQPSLAPGRRAQEATSRWTLTTEIERRRPENEISWGDLDRRYRNEPTGNNNTFNRPEIRYGRIGYELAFEGGEIVGQIQKERGFEPRWNGLLSLAAVPHRFHVLGVIGTIMRHWDEHSKFYIEWKRPRWDEDEFYRGWSAVAGPVWEVLHDPDLMDGGKMLARALATIAASCMDLYPWEAVAGDEFFEERIVLARYSKVIGAAWMEWRQSVDQANYYNLPEQYEAACRLMKRPRDADDVPQIHMRLAQLVLCEGYNFGADQLCDLVPNFYERWLECSQEILENWEPEDEYAEVCGPLNVRRERATPQWARGARKFVRT